MKESRNVVPLRTNSDRSARKRTWEILALRGVASPVRHERWRARIVVARAWEDCGNGVAVGRHYTRAIGAPDGRESGVV